MLSSFNVWFRGQDAASKARYCRSTNVVRHTATGFRGKRRVLKNAKAYSYVLEELIHKARYRLWIGMFLINPYPQADPELSVCKLLRALSRAKRNGVDVRVLIDRARGTKSLHNSNQLAYLLMRFYHIPCQYYSGKEKSMHSKYVIIDDNLLVVGSHNWSSGALHRDSDCFESKD